ncbi:MAG: hypothetical protein LUO88_04715, partial [Methanoregulaceae archaeon]|nr:hypothetical protein [Methanoregulaceae archaeon]
MRKEAILVAIIAILALVITPVIAEVFTINATSGPHGTIDPYGPQTVDGGSYPWFTITPDPFYHIDEVFIDGNLVDSVPAVTIPDVGANHTIYATFAIDRFDIVASAGAGGIISPSGTSTFDAQSSPTYFVYPDTGYHIVDVTVDGVPQGAVTQYTFSGIDADHTISVEFAIDQFTITAEATGNGNISPEGSILVNYGDNQTFSITPETGFHIELLSVDGSPVPPTEEYTFTNVTEDHSIAVTFEIDMFTIETTWGANGQISPVNPTVQYGESIFLDILPDTGYHIQSVVADGIPADTVPKFPFLEVADDHTLFAEFGVNQFTITPIQSDNGNISPESPVLVDYGNDSPEFVITPDPGFHIAHLIIDGEPIGPQSSYTFTGVQADHNISASFAMNTYTITPIAGPHGTIDPSDPVTVDFHGSQLFTFQPDPCYHVDEVLVNGEPQGSIPEYLFSDVTENSSIQVLFAIDTFTITASSGPNGSISPSGEQPVSCHASMPFVFLPDPGYRVADVIVDGTSVGALDTYTFTDVTADHTISVVFTVQTFVILANAGIHGTIEPSGSIAVPFGGSQEFTITPETGYQVADVIVDGTSVGSVPNYTFSDLTADHSILALFEIATFTINATSGAGGSISPPGITTVNYGGSQPYTITPSTGYNIANVYVNGNPQGAVSSFQFTNVVSDQTIRAEFAIKQFTLTATAGPGGAIAPSGVITVNYGGSQTFLISPDPGFGIQNVFVDGVSVGRNSTLMINNIIRNHNINALFVQPPVANFTGSPTVGTVPLTVQF